MLTLTRNANQSVITTTPKGETISVKVEKGNDKQVRLCIEAPQEYKILREELLRDAVA